MGREAERRGPIEWLRRGGAAGLLISTGRGAGFSRSPCRVKIEAVKRSAVYIRGHDEIGRHARFRFSCSNALGFESPCPHQLRNSQRRSVSRLWAENCAMLGISSPSVPSRFAGFGSERDGGCGLGASIFFAGARRVGARSSCRSSLCFAEGAETAVRKPAASAR